MKKKIVSGLMAMTMATMSMGLTAFAAADDVQVTIGKDQVDVNGQFSVSVDLASVPSSGLSSIDFAINYDSSLVKIDKVELDTVGKTGADSKEGDLGDTLFSWYDTGKQIVVVWATGLTDSQYWVKSNGAFLKITGTGKAAGTATLKGGAVDRAAYPGSSAKADVVFSAVGENTKDYGASFTDGEVKIGAPTPETTPAPSTTPPATKWGDATCDNQVDVSDAVLVCRFAVSDANAKLTDQGKANADVTHDGAVSGDDATKILTFIARIIDEEDLAK